MKESSLPPLVFHEHWPVLKPEQPVSLHQGCRHSFVDFLCGPFGQLCSITPIYTPWACWRLACAKPIHQSSVSQTVEGVLVKSSCLLLTRQDILLRAYSPYKYFANISTVFQAIAETKQNKQISKLAHTLIDVPGPADITTRVSVHITRKSKKETAATVFLVPSAKPMNIWDTRFRGLHKRIIKHLHLIC